MILESKVYDITKEYDDMFKIIVYKYGYDPNQTKEKNKKKNPLSFNMNYLEDSVRRSRKVIHDYVHCNQFDWFVTFTFDPKKVDRYDMSAVYTKMQAWLWRQHHKYPEFTYLIVPEKHKDGAIHFHALISNYGGAIKPTKVIQHNKRVHNITGFRFGFTNATKLDEDRSRSTAYLCKYITKDMETVANRRRYWCSKNLKKPETFYNKMYDLGLQHFLNPKTVVHETEYNVIHQVPKNLFD